MLAKITVKCPRYGSEEIVAYVLGDRSVKTASKHRNKLEELGITYERIATFKQNLTNAAHDIGKQYTNGIEGNDCILRHRMRRVFRKSCCFSKISSNQAKGICGS